MENKFVASTWDWKKGQITEIEIDRETKSSYWTKEHPDICNRKETSSHKLCDSYKEAKQWLIKKELENKESCIRQVNNANSALSRSESNLDRLYNL